MIEHFYKQLFNQDSIDKQIVVQFDGGEITNENLYQEDFEIKESLCSEPEMRFGRCEAGSVKFKVAKNVSELLGKKITVLEILDGDEQHPFQIGIYKVDTDTPNGDKNYRNVMAYDAMHDIINADVAEWYNSLTFPISQKDFRDSFFNYLDVEQEEVDLILDDMLIEQTVNTTTLSGKDVISSLCELNGVFGHIDRKGLFAYVSLPGRDSAEVVDGSRYLSCEFEEFETEFISKLQIRQEQNDIGVVVGDGANAYIIENNFLVYGKDPNDLEEIARKILAKITNISYRPMKVTLLGNPCLEVGDAILIHTKTKDVFGYVFERTIKGIQSLKDSIQAQGVQQYSEKVNSMQREINQLRGKTNALEKTVEKTLAKISDVEKGMATTIEQTSERVKIEIEAATKNLSNLQEEVAKNTENINKTTYEFGTEDFTVAKEGEEIETHISHKGMRVLHNKKEKLTANNEGVKAEDLHATTYLIVGDNSRLENYKKKRTGIFWIGS